MKDAAIAKIANFKREEPIKFFIEERITKLKKLMINEIGNPQVIPSNKSLRLIIKWSGDIKKCIEHLDIEVLDDKCVQCMSVENDD